MHLQINLGAFLLFKPLLASLGSNIFCVNSVTGSPRPILLLLLIGMFFSDPMLADTDHQHLF